MTVAVVKISSLYSKPNRKGSKWGTRWHIQNVEESKCVPACHQKDYAACGYLRKRDAKAVLANALGKFDC